MGMEDAESPGLLFPESDGEAPVDIDDFPAIEADEVVMRGGLGVEAPFAGLDGQLVDPALPLKRAESRIDGREGHRGESEKQGLVDLLRGRVGRVPLEMGQDGQLLRRPPRPLVGLNRTSLLIHNYY